MRRVDIGAEPIDADLKACIEAELADHPGAYVVKRRGQLFFRKNRFEILCERLCAVKAQWAAVEHADLADEEKRKIFALLLFGDAKLEAVPGVGLKLTLPARRSH